MERRNDPILITLHADPPPPACIPPTPPLYAEAEAFSPGGVRATIHPGAPPTGTRIAIDRAIGQPASRGPRGHSAGRGTRLTLGSLHAEEANGMGGGEAQRMQRFSAGMPLQMNRRALSPFLTQKHHGEPLLAIGMR